MYFKRPQAARRRGAGAEIMWAPGTGSARPEASARPKTRAHGCKQGHEHAAGMPSARAHDEGGRKRNAHSPNALQHSAADVRGSARTSRTATKSGATGGQRPQPGASRSERVQHRHRGVAKRRSSKRGTGARASRLARLWRHSRRRD